MSPAVQPSLAQRERTSRLEERLAVSGAVINKEQLREEIYSTLALLKGLAEPAAKEEPELAAGSLRAGAQREAQRPGRPRRRRAELVAVTAEIMLIVRQLDALNRFRFRKDAESLAAVSPQPCRRSEERP